MWSCRRRHHPPRKRRKPGSSSRWSRTAATGRSAWEGFSRRLSAEYLNLWQVGEESGELDKTVDKIAQISADRAELRFQYAAYWLPLAFYLVIAIRIAFMIVTMAGQIWNFSDFEF